MSEACGDVLNDAPHTVKAGLSDALFPARVRVLSRSHNVPDKTETSATKRRGKLVDDLRINLSTANRVGLDALVPEVSSSNSKLIDKPKTAIGRISLLCFGVAN
jgi:hypothetical protein